MITDEFAARPETPNDPQGYYNFLKEPRYYVDETEFEYQERKFVLKEVNARMDKQESEDFRKSLVITNTVSVSPLLRKLIGRI